MEIKYDPTVWFSSRYAIYNLWALIKEDGVIIKKSRKYQKEREAWIVGVTLLGVMKLFDYIDLWWLKIPDEDPPDILTMTVTPDELANQNTQNEREIEVMEFTKYSKSTLLKEILGKMKNKFYKKETGLIIYLRKDMEIKDMRLLSKNLVANNLRIADIWVIGNINKANNEFILFSLLPEVKVTRFDIDSEIKKLPLGDTIKMFRGKGVFVQRTKAPVAKFNPNSEKQVFIS